MDDFSAGRSSEYHDVQPQSPLGSPAEDPFLSPLTALNSVNDVEPLIQRKPILPKRSSRSSLEERSYELVEKPILPRRSSRSSLEKRSYELVEIKPMKSGATGNDYDETSRSELLLPKAFRKTHSFLGLDLGYWRLPARHFSIFSVLILATVLPLYYVSNNISNIIVDEGNLAFFYDCTGSSSGWTFVGVNLRFGRFNYGSAKALDLAWNWIVGRGLQALFTLIAYRVFNDALLRAAEMMPLSYELYASLSLYSTKPDILWQLLKGLARHGNWRTKAIFSYLLISTCYLVMFPSLMDACSGYEASTITNFIWPNDTTEDITNLYDWNDDLSIVTVSQGCLVWNIAANSTPYNYTFWPYSINLTNLTVYQVQDTACYSLQTSTKGSESSSGYYWQESAWNTTWWTHFYQDPYSTDWESWGFPPSMPSNFECVTENGVYQWGFSFEWLFVVTVVNSAWLVGLWILWVDCDTNSELCKKGRRLGLWRAVADISEAIREELGPNICAYSEQELATALKSKPPIKYCVKNGTEDEPGHIGLSSRSSGRFRLRWNHEYGRSGR